ncbi:MAG TPA: 3-dehydroquinate synthase [Anaerolineales bacterium]|nr:3-dehydroquinate synthase [Anaerolineales bacterium]
MSHLFLYGPSGAGKTTVGKLLAARLDLSFLDLDDEIEKTGAGGISGLFDREGEAGFRAVERRELERLAARPGEVVIALGGGALLDPQSRTIAERSGRVLCLRASAGELLDRLQSDPGDRPLFENDLSPALQRYLEMRSAHYDSFDLQLDTTWMSTDEAAASAGRAFGAFRVTGMNRPYPVRVERGVLARLPDLLEAGGLTGPFALVADANTAVYAERIASALSERGEQTSVTVIPAGEDQKTIETVQTLWTAFVSAGLERRSTVVAAGGGVVCDLAGFAAATYLRGVAWVAAPTSLLAMVDASLGGKTGADLPQGKNLVGAFHPPSLVAADIDTLSTLPARELRNGLAEMVKAGVIGDPELFDSYRGWDGGVPPPDWITRSMDVKIRTIEADPLEKGPRAVLNFGHTVGHAVEHVSGYSLAHGEAVAIGMTVETALAEQLGIAEKGLSARITDRLAHLGLPTAIPSGLDRDRILEVMDRDKKVAGGRLRFALPHRIGAVEVVEVGRGEVIEVLKV